MSTTMERYAEGGGSTICFFDVVCTQNDEVVMTMNTAFGFFKPEANRVARLRQNGEAAFDGVGDLLPLPTLS